LFSRSKICSTQRMSFVCMPRQGLSRTSLSTEIGPQMYLVARPAILCGGVAILTERGVEKTIAEIYWRLLSGFYRK
jgi:hypothetical protein